MARSPAAGVRVSHVALAVADLDVSTRFYREGLGFELGMSFRNGDDMAGVSEVEPPVRMRCQFLVKDGFRLELMGWETPPVHGTPARLRNQRGLTHLSFEVDDADATQARLLELGGAAIPGARLYIDEKAITLLFLADPDGTRIELLQRHASPA
jgi:catechol 2,3-dioxygenase-like lactoylglutathione lyase family enzyme